MRAAKYIFFTFTYRSILAKNTNQLKEKTVPKCARVFYRLSKKSTEFEYKQCTIVNDSLSIVYVNLVYLYFCQP